MSKYTGDVGYQAFRILQFVFVVAPIIAGVDKFLYLLTNWSKYVAPHITQIVGVSVFLAIVGVIEIIAGLGVAWRPRIFSYVVAIWLLLIIINLLIQGQYYDIALRDLGLLLSAVALGRLSEKYANVHRSL